MRAVRRGLSRVREPEFRTRLWAILTTSGITYAGMGLSLLSTPMLAQALGAEGRGFLAAAFVTTQLLSWVGFLGLPRVMGLQAIKLGAASRRGIIALTGLGFVNAALCFATADLVSNGDSRVALAVRIASLVLIANGICQLGIESALAAGKVLAFNITRAGTMILPSLIFIVAFVAGSLTIEVAYLATLSGLVFTMIFGIVLAVRYSRPWRRLPVPWSEGFHYWSATALDSVGGRIDQLLLATLASPAILGTYAVAITLAAASGALTQAIGHTSYSRFVTAAREGRVNSIGRLSRLGLVSSLLSGAVVVVAVVLFGEALLGPTFVGLAPTTAILVVSQALNDQWALRVYADTAGGASWPLSVASGAAVVTIVVAAIALELSGLLSAQTMAGALVLGGGVRLGVRFFIGRVQAERSDLRE